MLSASPVMPLEAAMDFETAGDAPVATETYSAQQSLGEESSLQPVRLPGEPEVADIALAPLLAAGERLSETSELPPGNADHPGVFGEHWVWVRRVLQTRRGRLLLAGASLIAVSAIAGAVLLPPYAHVHLMAQQSAVSRMTHRRQPPPLAPAASLAGVPVPPATPVVRPRFEPTEKAKQLQELMSFRNGASAAPPAVPPDNKSAAAIGMPSAAPAPIRRETKANSKGASVGSAERAAGPAAAAREGASGPVTAVVAALPKPAPATHRIPAAPASPKPAAAASMHRPAPAAVSATDPVELAAALRPAPMTPANQVQVLELVTQVATEVRDLREEDGQLRADFARTTADTSARLADFERRLALVEARHAVAAVHAADAAPAADAPPPPAPALTQTAAAGADPDRAVRYRVQAASPGLALLAEIDRGGGEGAQREVLVGDTIPGYGRVEWIGQRGTAWVVETQHGNIE
jgi:hypothetical protein